MEPRSVHALFPLAWKKPDSLSRRIVRVLARRGLLIADPEYPSLDWVPDSSLDHLQAASVSYRIAIGPRAGRKARADRHAATVCEAWQRSRLERLCRYITRPPIATRRLSVDGRGRVTYRYKQPFRDGSTQVVLEPPDFIARLAALVPRPRLNLTRFHGVFAPNFKHRPRGRVDSDKPTAPSNAKR